MTITNFIAYTSTYILQFTAKENNKQNEKDNENILKHYYDFHEFAHSLFLI